MTGNVASTGRGLFHANPMTSLPTMNINHRPGLMARGIALAAILCVTVACSGRADAPPTIGPKVIVLTLQPQNVTLTTEVAGYTSIFLTAEIRPQVGGIILQRLFEEGSDVEAGQPLYQIDPANYLAAFNRARAALSAAEAKELAARLRAQTRVTAPISGLIGNSTVASGALVTAGQSTPLTTVLLLDPIYVDVTQSPVAVQRMKQEQNSGASRVQVRLQLADGSEYAYSGKLEFWEVSVDEGPSSISLRAVFPNPEGELLPGMSVRAQLPEGVRSEALLVPQRAVTHDASGQATVFVVGTNNRVEVRPVTAERRVGDQWLISAGLKAGERVVVDGVQRVRPGITVTPVPFPANAPEADQKSAALVAAN